VREGGRGQVALSKVKEEEGKVMNKVEENKVAVNYVELEGKILLELLEGVATHAGRDKSLPTLNAVDIESEGGLFKAKATDRYRLIEGSLQTLDGRLDASLIALDDIKRVIALCKDHKANRVQLSRIGDTITVSSLGDAITISVLAGTYPPTEQLLSDSEGEPTAVDSVAFNPAYMADYAKIAGKGAPIKIYFTGNNKPMRVRITGDKINWRALLMPVRYID
jgi:DNA polymerase III sliding clamp (beta) subunit (PCNA family)